MDIHLKTSSAIYLLLLSQPESDNFQLPLGELDKA